MQQANINRRDFVRHATGSLSYGFTMGARPVAAMLGFAALAPPGSPALAQDETNKPDAKQFSADIVIEAARALAKRPYKQLISPLPAAISSMTPEAEAAIRFRRTHLIWNEKNAPFAIEPIHRTRQTPNQISIFLVENGLIRPLNFDPAQFVYANGKTPVLPEKTGLAGFRIYQRDERGVLADAARFYAPDIYQAVGRNQSYGIAARPLSVRTSDGKAEEPVALRAIWIEKAAPAQKALVVHALFDSRTMAGALRFSIRPGIASIIDTECTMFARTDVAEFGLGAMAAAHLSGSLNTRFVDDIRPAIHEINGLQIHSGKNEWIWRPVANGARLQVSAFIDKDTRGYGLLQRDRRYETFLDSKEQWQRRPSLWIEPIGKWGPGEVTLLEIPTAFPNNKNIGCYWRPAQGLKAGSERRYVFRQFWCWTPPDTPELAHVARSRHGRVRFDDKTRTRQYYVEFTGQTLFPDAAGRDFQARVSATKSSVKNIRVYPSVERKSVGVVFDVEAGSTPAVELRLQLMAGQQPVSETWLYRWTQ